MYIEMTYTWFGECQASRIPRRTWYIYTYICIYIYLCTYKSMLDLTGVHRRTFHAYILTQVRAWVHASLCVNTGACAIRLRHTHASKPNTTQFKQLTFLFAITSSLPPISYTYFTTSRCPLEQADMRQVSPPCKRWPSDHHHTLSPQPWQGSLQLLSHSYHTRARASAGPHTPQSLRVLCMR